MLISIALMHVRSYSVPQVSRWVLCVTRCDSSLAACGLILICIAAIIFSHIIFHYSSERPARLCLLETMQRGPFVSPFTFQWRKVLRAETDKWNVIKSSPGKCQVGWNPAASNSLPIRCSPSLLAGATPALWYGAPPLRLFLSLPGLFHIPAGMTEEWISHGIILGWSCSIMRYWGAAAFLAVISSVCSYTECQLIEM